MGDRHVVSGGARRGRIQATVRGSRQRGRVRNGGGLMTGLYQNGLDDPERARSPDDEDNDQRPDSG